MLTPVRYLVAPQVVALVLKHIAIRLFEFLDCRPKLLAQLKQQMLAEAPAELQERGEQGVVHVDDREKHPHRNFAGTYRQRPDLALEGLLQL